MSEPKFDNLRVVSVETINAILTQLYESNKKAFDLYFNLIQARETNKLTTSKSATTSTKNPGSDSDSDQNNRENLRLDINELEATKSPTSIHKYNNDKS